MTERNQSSSFDRLKNIIDRLRDPGGCPWDKRQTHESLKPYLVEECYEVIQAIDEGGEKLREELGDLLLQVMLHSRIESEQRVFDINAVMDGLSDKLVRRHPHVFGDKKAPDLKDMNHNWHALKQEELGKEKSILSGAPLMMPALAHSQLLQRKVAAVGFDWEKTGDILEKLNEEVGELLAAESFREKTSEFGDVLFVLVNLSRRMGIDAEESLRLANERFFKRFSYMEKLCKQRGLSFESLSFSQQNALWDEAKKNTE